MPGTLPGLDTGNILKGTTTRVGRQERATSETKRPVSRETAVFSTAVTPIVATSGPWEVETGGAITAIVTRCTTAATSGSSVIQVLHNGALIATITLVAGATRRVDYVTPVHRVPATDALSVSITAVGTGVKSIVVQVRMRA